MTDFDIKSFVNELANEIMDYHDFMGNDGYHTKSKNVNSLYHYLYKICTKGSIKEMMDTLEKLGVKKNYLEMYNINLEYKNYDWWDANRK